jgi:hypothetical protein
MERGRGADVRTLAEQQTWARAEYRRLDEFRHAVVRDTRTVPIGLACDECGKELSRNRPLYQMDSSPPQAFVECQACGWKGTMIL